MGGIEQTNRGWIPAGWRPFGKRYLKRVTGSSFRSRNRHCFPGKRKGRDDRIHRWTVGSFGEQEGKRCFRFVASQLTRALIARGVKRVSAFVEEARPFSDRSNPFPPSTKMFAVICHSSYEYWSLNFVNGYEWISLRSIYLCLIIFI